MALTLAILAPPAPAGAASPGGTYGVYAGSGKPAEAAAFEAHTGRPLHRAHDFLARESWSAMTNVTWWTDQWAPTPYATRMVYSVPMLPDSGGTLAEGATGAFNSYFETLATKFVAAGQGSAILRLGHEFNGDWFRWTIAVPNGAANYAAYWRQIVTTMRAVPGANFTFDWSPNRGSAYVNGQQLEAEDAWPGDAYVDYVGLDVYDQSWVANHDDPAARWSDYLSEHNGLRWQRDFAAAHGKPMTFPEWGLAHRDDGHGGGDAPYFIERMHAWITSNNVAYNLYFDFADATTDSALFDGRFPKGAQRFVELFGSDPTDRSAGGAATTGRAAGGVGAGIGPGATGAAPARLTISRAQISRRQRRLVLRGSISRLASGSVRVQLRAGGRQTTFAAKITRGAISVSKAISRAQARRGTGIVTISYAGNASTRAQKVTLRAARARRTSR